MSRSPIALAVLLFAALLVPASPAQAAYSVLCTGYSSCEGKGYSHGGYESHKGTSDWNMYTGTNCTNYVAYRLVTTNGMPNKRPKAGVGNARDWGTTMSSVTDNVPTVGSVAWWGKTGNHVAYVEKVVSSTEVLVSESNWSGAFDWRKITKSGSGWPDGFIHFSDPRIVNETKPEVVGTPKVDTAIKATGGVWSPTGNTYTYQWLANGTAISGATAKTFTPSATHATKSFSVRVTAARPSYPTVNVTSPAIEVERGTFKRTTAPAVTGTPKVDSTLTAASGALAPVATNQTYLWFADGVAISSARSSTFSPGPELVGKKISVRIRSARSGYTTNEATSAQAAAVALGDILSTVRPAISGTAAVGSRLTSSAGTWSKTGLTLGYQWRANGVAIAGATAARYDVTPADRGKTLDVVVTARRNGYVSATAAARSTTAVVPGTFTARSAPTVSGAMRVGSKLTASTGSWSATGAYSYQWYSDGSAIKGATQRTYVPTRHDLGDRLRVRVTLRRDGFTTASALSARAAAVTSGRISISAAPTVTGSPRLGSVLKVAPGVHSPSNTSLRYQWLRDGKKISGATKRTHRVSKTDLGHRLTVKVTMSASGYTPRSSTTASIGRATATAKLSASASAPGSRKVTFSIRVSASRTAAPDGTVTIRSGTKRLVTAKVRRGRATVSLSKQPVGRQTYQLTFNGTKTVSTATYSRSVTVR
ncbi:CHAP domain-containing protein [Aeromicrobium sp. UC242_57]|uniref:CHAP domain-containing protein n=1 Tax=Aeromicrobium sp. UC242_57 TaxID=3374624 RepID=UPI0037A7D9FA